MSKSETYKGPPKGAKGWDRQYRWLTGTKGTTSLPTDRQSLNKARALLRRLAEDGSFDADFASRYLSGDSFEGSLDEDKAQAALARIHHQTWLRCTTSANSPKQLVLERSEVTMANQMMVTLIDAFYPVKEKAQEAQETTEGAPEAPAVPKLEPADATTDWEAVANQFMGNCVCPLDGKGSLPTTVLQILDKVFGTDPAPSQPRMFAEGVLRGCTSPTSTTHHNYRTLLATLDKQLALYETWDNACVLNLESEKEGRMAKCMLLTLINLRNPNSPAERAAEDPSATSPTYTGPAPGQDDKTWPRPEQRAGSQCSRDGDPTSPGTETLVPGSGWEEDPPSATASPGGGSDGAGPSGVPPSETEQAAPAATPTQPPAPAAAASGTSELVPPVQALMDAHKPTQATEGSGSGTTAPAAQQCTPATGPSSASATTPAPAKAQTSTAATGGDPPNQGDKIVIRTVNKRLSEELRALLINAQLGLTNVQLSLARFQKMLTAHIAISQSGGNLETLTDVHGKEILKLYENLQRQLVALREQLTKNKDTPWTPHIQHLIKQFEAALAGEDPNLLPPEKSWGELPGKIRSMLLDALTTATAAQAQCRTLASLLRKKGDLRESGIQAMRREEYGDIVDTHLQALEYLNQLGLYLDFEEPSAPNEAARALAQTILLQLELAFVVYTVPAAK